LNKIAHSAFREPQFQLRFSLFQVQSFTVRSSRPRLGRGKIRLGRFGATGFSMNRVQAGGSSRRVSSRVDFLEDRGVRPRINRGANPPNDDLIARHLRPGWGADLLAVTWFFSTV